MALWGRVPDAILVAGFLESSDICLFSVPPSLPHLPSLPLTSPHFISVPPSSLCRSLLLSLSPFHLFPSSLPFLTFLHKLPFPSLPFYPSFPSFLTLIPFLFSLSFFPSPNALSFHLQSAFSILLFPLPFPLPFPSPSLPPFPLVAMPAL